MKTCATCKTKKPLTEFGKHGSRLRSACKACHSAAQRAYASANRQTTNAKKAEWRTANPENMKSYRDKWLSANADAVRAANAARGSARYAKNLDLSRAASRQAAAKRRAELKDSYITQLLVGSHSFLPRTAIPQILLEVKREHIKLLRLIKDMTT